MTGHPSLDELSDWTSGLLEAPRSDEVLGHVDTCPDCTAEVTALQDVSDLLAAEPVPAMPADVFGRLSGVVASESQRRTARSSAGHHLLTPPRPTLGSFDATYVRPHRRRRGVARALLALGVAAAVGFGGYVLSATAGLNEPVSTTPVTINPETLSKQASALRQATDLSPHRFSQAWRCARAVTDGRITGIRPITLDGEPGYLVYLDRDDRTQVSVVRGCGTGTPVVGPSAEIPDR